MEFVRRVSAQESNTTRKEMSRNTLFEPVWKCNVQKMLIFHWDQFLETTIHFVSRMGQVTFVAGGKLNGSLFLQCQRSRDGVSKV